MSVNAIVRRRDIELFWIMSVWTFPLGKALAFSGSTGQGNQPSSESSEMPSHPHTLRGSADDGDLTIPAAGRVLAKAQGQNLYNTANSLAMMAGEALTPAGGDQPHNNMQPYLTFYFCIALQGVFPPRT